MSSQFWNSYTTGNISSDESVEQFIQHGLYLRNWSPRTARAYRYALKDLPAVLTKASLDAWIIKHRQQRHTPGGMNVRIRAVNSYLSWLRIERLEGDDQQPVPAPLKLMKAPKMAVQTLSTTEIRAILSAKPDAPSQYEGLANNLIAHDVIVEAKAETASSLALMYTLVAAVVVWPSDDPLLDIL